MCLRFMFLLTTWLAAWLRLARREETWKTAEVLILRHQLAVLQRQQPRRPNLDWADRALLATLLAVIPKDRRHGLRLLVTPDTVLRWHRDIVRRRWAARSMRGKTGRPATRRGPGRRWRRRGRRARRSCCGREAAPRLPAGPGPPSARAGRGRCRGRSSSGGGTRLRSAIFSGTGLRSGRRGKGPGPGAW